MARLRFTFQILSVAVLSMLLVSCGDGSKHVGKAADLEGARIGVQSGTTGATLAADIENSEVSEYDKAVDAVRALKQKRIDAVIVDLDTANALAKDDRKIRVLDEDFAEENYAIAVQKDNTFLRSRLNESLRKLTERGVMQEIKMNYEGDEQGMHQYVKSTGVNRDQGTIVMATNAEFPPYESYNSDGEMVGFDIDMMNAVCDYLGYELKIEDMPFDDILDAVANGDADVGVAGLSVTNEREDAVLFTDTYATTRQVIIVRK